MKKITSQIVSDGITDVARISLSPGATVNDAFALLKAVARPTESLAQEVERRAAELDKQAVGLAKYFQVAVRQCTDEARHMSASGEYTPAQVRGPLEKAEWLIYQGSAAPLMAKAKKFEPKGRGKGPIRKLIAKLLKKSPSMKNPALWDAVQAHPPRGYSVKDNHLGKYIEGPTPSDKTKERNDMDYRRFSNICSEERKSLKGP
ncbi:hypothetical protein KIH07_18520 [Hydrogenophaga taeniospiralis]|uniref:hypothetical protein n=1 Tax=Hydrogenophaga taeniospiralis TaxID=65656 RepID=UPI001CFB1D90|nr:hypothetical protein [Hydrogenophaga taeniospiralis]MCB4365735.1 hypothetical protein [Hydrogenophaga taeniospiralis]